MKQNNQRTILFSKYDYTKPYYPNDLTGKEVLLYNYILGLKKGFEELHHCKMTYMYLSYSHFIHLKTYFRDLYPQKRLHP